MHNIEFFATGATIPNNSPGGGIMEYSYSTDSYYIQNAVDYEYGVQYTLYLQRQYNMCDKTVTSDNML
jgi:hypothetical protein